jgi:CheY-like chemotaxis protein
MRVMNGIEFSQTAKGDPELRKIPVVVLTTSEGAKGQSRQLQPRCRRPYAQAGRLPRQLATMIRSVDVHRTSSELPE